MIHQLDLTGCWAKVSRAEEHLADLRNRVQGFVNSGAYRITKEQDFYADEVVVYGEVVREPPMTDWGVVIGDIVHNLRSALDQLVWQLTLASGKTPPDPIPRGKAGRNWRTIAFPIYLDAPCKDASNNPVP